MKKTAETEVSSSISHFRRHARSCCRRRNFLGLANTEEVSWQDFFWLHTRMSTCSMGDDLYSCTLHTSLAVLLSTYLWAQPKAMIERQQSTRRPMRLQRAPRDSTKSRWRSAMRCRKSRSVDGPRPTICAAQRRRGVAPSSQRVRMLSSAGGSVGLAKLQERARKEARKQARLISSCQSSHGKNCFGVELAVTQSACETQALVNVPTHNQRAGIQARVYSTVEAYLSSIVTYFQSFNAPIRASLCTALSMRIRLAFVGIHHSRPSPTLLPLFCSFAHAVAFLPQGLSTP
eukprot:5344995-Pleurochrysis_carterae.AAC.4